MSVIGLEIRRSGFLDPRDLSVGSGPREIDVSGVRGFGVAGDSRARGVCMWRCPPVGRRARGLRLQSWTTRRARG